MTLPGPSRTIRVEPVELPQRDPVPLPAPAPPEREPAPEPAAPEHEPVPA